MKDYTLFIHPIWKHVSRKVTDEKIKAGLLNASLNFKYVTPDNLEPKTQGAQHDMVLQDELQDDDALDAICQLTKGLKALPLDFTAVDPATANGETLFPLTPEEIAKVKATRRADEYQRNVDALEAGLNRITEAQCGGVVKPSEYNQGED